MRRVRTAVVALGLFAAGCGGPRLPLEVGVKEFPSDVIIGAAKQQAPVPLPVVPLPVDARRRGLVEQPALTSLSPPPPPTPVDLCPEADPLGAPAIEAPNRSIAPPVAGTYYFRNEGDFQLGQVRGKVPPLTTRTIQNVEGSGEVYTFEVADQLTALTYSWSVDATGMHLTKLTQEIEGQTVTFDPNPALRFAQYPLENGTRWSSGGADVQDTLAAWVFDGVVGAQPDADHDGKPDDADGDGTADPPAPKMRVDACGQWIDAWAIRMVGPNDQGRARWFNGTYSDFQVDAVLAYATQFGTIGVQETWAYDGVAGGQEFHLHYTTTIAQVPALSPQ